jgi:hypothetical protein
MLSQTHFLALLLSNSHSDPDDLEDPVNYVIASLKSNHPDLMLDEIIRISKDDQSYSELKLAVLSDSVKSAESGYVAQFK